MSLFLRSFATSSKTKGCQGDAQGGPNLLLSGVIWMVFETSSEIFNRDQSTGFCIASADIRVLHYNLGDLREKSSRGTTFPRGDCRI